MGTVSSTRQRRYLALWLPFLSTDRLHRLAAANGEEPDERPTVVAARDGGAMRIAAVDPRGLRLGLSPGLALADARARIPDIAVAEQDEAADRFMLSAIADWCDRYSPVVAEEGPDALILEIAGSTHLFGGEVPLLGDLCTRLRASGFDARAAVAGTPDCARALSRYGTGGVVAPGGEMEATGDLPVSALEFGLETTVALRRAGLATIAELARRPRKPIAARFGSALVVRLAGILGEIERPITPRRPLPDFSAEQRFPDPIGLSQDIHASLDILAHRICGELERQGRGGRVFEAAFFRADGTVRRVAALSGRPLRDPAALLRLFEERLDSLADPLDPGFGFDMIRLAALAGQKADPVQRHLERDVAESRAFDDLVDRLTARFGPGAVERFLPRDSHLPERAARRLPALCEIDASGRPEAPSWPAPMPGEPPLRPLFLFTPPQPVETVAEVPDGPPFRFRWRRVLHEVAHAEGPERIAPEWWRGGGALTRDYYRVEDRDGRRFWIFREGIYGRETTSPAWYVHGLFQ
jgi:protein ImuB